jgi:hypothetical protein
MLCTIICIPFTFTAVHTGVRVPVLHVPVVQLHVPYTVTYLFPMCTVVPHDDDIHTHAYMLTYM